VEYPRDVVVVITDAESPPNQLANSRPRPDAAYKSTGEGSGFDERNELILLVRAQSRHSTRGRLWPQSISACSIEPLQPAIDGPARHVELFAERDHCRAADVFQHRLGPPPRLQIPSALCAVEHSAQCFHFSWSSPLRPDGLSFPRSQNDPLVKEIAAR
jgi:hypothetical protein